MITEYLEQFILKFDESRTVEEYVDFLESFGFGGLGSDRINQELELYMLLLSGRASKDNLLQLEQFADGYINDEGSDSVDRYIGIMFRSQIRYHKRDYSGAIEDISALIANNITGDCLQQYLYSNRALFRLHTGEFDEALNDCLAVLTAPILVKIAHINSCLARSHICIEQHDHVRAFHDISMAERIDESFPITWLSKGLLLHSARQDIRIQSIHSVPQCYFRFFRLLEQFPIRGVRDSSTFLAMQQLCNEYPTWLFARRILTKSSYQSLWTKTRLELLDRQCQPHDALIAWLSSADCAINEARRKELHARSCRHNGDPLMAVTILKPHFENLVENKEFAAIFDLIEAMDYTLEPESIVNPMLEDAAYAATAVINDQMQSDPMMLYFAGRLVELNGEYRLARKAFARANGVLEAKYMEWSCADDMDISTHESDKIIEGILREEISRQKARATGVLRITPLTLLPDFVGGGITVWEAGFREADLLSVIHRVRGRILKKAKVDGTTNRFVAGDRIRTAWPLFAELLGISNEGDPLPADYQIQLSEERFVHRWVIDKNSAERLIEWRAQQTKVAIKKLKAMLHPTFERLRLVSPNKLKGRNLVTALGGAIYNSEIDGDVKWTELFQFFIATKSLKVGDTIMLVHYLEFRRAFLKAQSSSVNKFVLQTAFCSVTAGLLTILGTPDFVAWLSSAFMTTHTSVANKLAEISASFLTEFHNGEFPTYGEFERKFRQYVDELNDSTFEIEKVLGEVS